MEVDPQPQYLEQCIARLQNRTLYNNQESKYYKCDQHQREENINIIKAVIVKQAKNCILNVVEDKDNFLQKYINQNQLQTESQLSSFSSTDFQFEEQGEEVEQRPQQDNTLLEYYIKRTPKRFKVQKAIPETNTLPSPQANTLLQLNTEYKNYQQENGLNNNTPQNYNTAGKNSIIGTINEDELCETEYIEPLGGFVDEINELNRQNQQLRNQTDRQSIKQQVAPNQTPLQLYTPLGGFAQDIRDLNSIMAKNQKIFQTQIPQNEESSTKADISRPLLQDRSNNPEVLLIQTENQNVTPLSQKAKINADNKYIQSRQEDQQQEVGEVFEFPKLVGELDMEPARQKRNKTQKRLSFNESLISFYHMSQTTMDEEELQSDALQIGKEDLLKLADDLNKTLQEETDENNDQSLIESQNWIEEQISMACQDLGQTINTPRAIKKLAQFSNITQALQEYIQKKQERKEQNQYIQPQQQNQTQLETQINNTNEKLVQNNNISTQGRSNSQSQVKNKSTPSNVQRQDSIKREPFKNITQQALNNSDPQPQSLPQSQSAMHISPTNTNQLQQMPQHNVQQTPNQQQRTNQSQTPKTQLQNQFPGGLRNSLPFAPQTELIKVPNNSQVTPQQQTLNSNLNPKQQFEQAQPRNTQTRLQNIEQQLEDLKNVILGNLQSRKKEQQKTVQQGDQMQTDKGDQDFPIQRLNFLNHNTAQQPGTQKGVPADDQSMVANVSISEQVQNVFPNDSPNRPNYQCKTRSQNQKTQQNKLRKQNQEFSNDKRGNDQANINNDYSLETAEDFIPSPRDTITVSNQDNNVNSVRKPQRSSSRSQKRLLDSNSKGSTTKKRNVRAKTKGNSPLDIGKELRLAEQTNNIDENYNNEMSQSLSLADNSKKDHQQQQGTSKQPQVENYRTPNNELKNLRRRRPANRNKNGKQFLGAVYPSPNLLGGTQMITNDKNQQVRRTTRQRMSPIEYWRGEHVEYERKHHALHTVKQVVRRTTPDPVKLFKSKIYNGTKRNK